MCKLIDSIFFEVFGRKMDKNVLDDTILAQKVVYLMESKGIRVGGYGFSWKKYGLFSIDLQKDIEESIPTVQPIVFSEAAKSAINEIKNILERAAPYSMRYWLEAITSAHFIKVIKHDSFIEDGDLLDEIMAEKEYLDSRDKNAEALKIANSYAV